MMMFSRSGCYSEGVSISKDFLVLYIISVCFFLYIIYTNNLSVLVLLFGVVLVSFKLLFSLRVCILMEVKIFKPWSLYFRVLQQTLHSIPR